MSLIAKETGGADYEPIPEGTYAAICYAVVDLGTHYNERFKKDAHKVLLTWELPEERIEVTRDGQMLDLPRAISRRYTMSLHAKAALRHDLEAWRGKRFTDEELKGFDLSHIVGAACLLGIVHETGKRDGKTYASISSIMALPGAKAAGKGKKAAPPKPENTPIVFAIPDEPEPNFDIPDTLPEWVVKTIQESKEWHGEMASQQPPIEMPTSTSEGDEAPDGAEDDNLPF